MRLRLRALRRPTTLSTKPRYAARSANSREPRSNSSSPSALSQESFASSSTAPWFASASTAKPRISRFWWFLASGVMGRRCCVCSRTDALWRLAPGLRLFPTTRELSNVPIHDSGDAAHRCCAHEGRSHAIRESLPVLSMEAFFAAVQCQLCNLVAESRGAEAMVAREKIYDGALVMHDSHPMIASRLLT